MKRLILCKYVAVRSGGAGSEADLTKMTFQSSKKSRKTGYVWLWQREWKDCDAPFTFSYMAFMKALVTICSRVTSKLTDSFFRLVPLRPKPEDLILKLFFFSFFFFCHMSDSHSLLEFERQRGNPVWKLF